MAEKIKEKNQGLLQASAHGSASHLDWRGLKKGAAPDAVIELVTWIAEGFVRKVNADALRLDEGCYRDFDHYMELLKNGLYEREGE